MRSLGEEAMGVVYEAVDRVRGENVALKTLRWLSGEAPKRVLEVGAYVGFPGAPDYRAYMREHEGTRFRTVEHETHVEYQTLIKDLVLESTLL